MSKSIGHRIVWTLSGTVLYGRRIFGDVCHNLIVERLPRTGSWDWAVWESGKPPEKTSCGITSTAEQAITQAEAQVRDALAWEKRV